MAGARGDDLYCYICLGTCEQPRALTCQHIFCGKCIERQLVDVLDDLDDDVIYCPTCWVPTTLPSLCVTSPPHVTPPPSFTAATLQKLEKSSNTHKNPSELRCSEKTSLLKKQQHLIGVIGAELSHPYGIAIAADDSIIVSEQYSNMVVVCTSEGVVTRRFKVTEQGQLKGVAVSPDSHILVADRDNHCIVKMAMCGSKVASVGSLGGGPLQFRLPYDVTADSKGRVYVSDSVNDRIQVLHPDLSFSHMFGGRGSEPGQFRFPIGVAIDSQQTLYVCDHDNFRVQRFSPDGTFIGEFGSTALKGPYYIAVNVHDIVYVADVDSKQVAVFDNSGRYLSSIGRGVVPYGIAINSKKFIHVCSGYDNICVF